MGGKWNKSTIAYIVYVGLFLALSLAPVAAFSDKQGTIGNEAEADKPKLADGLDFPKKAEAYFAQNFGFRNELVCAGNSLKQAVFKTSGQEEVIIGEDGWLFYMSALKDYMGTGLLDEVQLDKIAVIIEMMQNYANSCGREFVFFSAPNKMSVYGEYMPYYYMESGMQGNYEELYKRLEDAGVNAVRLKNVLSAAKLSGVQTYHRLDSHWNNYGAAVAYEAVAGSLREYYGEEYAGYTSYTKLPYNVVNNFTGDLQSMLLPGSDVKDKQIEFDTEENFEYTSRYRGADDLHIATENSSPAVNKKVTLFRDSFGNALYWFFANEYAVMNARREVPYNIYLAAEESDLIAVELVERNLGNLLLYTPVVPSANMAGELSGQLESAVKADEEYEVMLHMTTTADGLLEITGVCEELSGEAKLYMMAESGEDVYLYQVLPCEESVDFVLYLQGQDAYSLKELLPGEDKTAALCFLTVNDGILRKISAKVTLQD